MHLDKLLNENWKDAFPGENRYFEDENILLYLGNSKDILARFPGRSCDLLITDLPYGINKYDYEKDADLFFELEELYFNCLKRNSWFIFFWTIKRIPEKRREKTENCSQTAERRKINETYSRNAERG